VKYLVPILVVPPKMLPYVLWLSSPGQLAAFGPIGTEADFVTSGLEARRELLWGGEGLKILVSIV
jgi:hypothetical protein